MKTTFTLSKYKDQYNMNHRHIEAKMFDKMPKRNRTTKELSNHSPKTKIVQKKKRMKPNTRIGILSVKVGEMIPKFLFLGRISEEYFSGSGEVELVE